MFMSPGLTNTNSENRSVPEKGLDGLCLFNSLVFLQIKASLVFHGWFKNIYAIQECFYHKLVPEAGHLLRF